MSKLLLSRTGSPLRIKGRQISFSLWPIGQKTTNYCLQSRIFITNPWHVMRRAVTDAKHFTQKDSALAFIEHAEDYYKAATLGEIGAVKPVLFYYSYLNIAKAFSLFKNIRNDYSKARHGISESDQNIDEAKIEIHPSTNQDANVFADFYRAITGQAIIQKRSLPIIHLLPQILQGHRLWCLSNIREQERFYHIDVLSIQENCFTKEVWIDMLFPHEDLTRHNLSPRKLLLQSRAHELFRHVKIKRASKKEYIKFQTIKPEIYNQRPAPFVQKLINKIKPYLWVNVISIPPYRKYYLYLCPKSENTTLLPQLLSIYALFYYLGSVTRYRPNNYQAILDGKNGAQIQEIIENVPQQFVYLMASEFAEQEIVRAAII